MAFTSHTGHGGHAAVGAGAVLTGVTLWHLIKQARKAEVTNSQSGGIAKWKKVLTEGNGFFNFVWDSDQLKDVDVAYDVGDGPALRLTCGDSGKFYDIAEIIVDQLETIDDQQTDVVRGVCTFTVNGVITDPVT